MTRNTDWYTKLAPLYNLVNLYDSGYRYARQKAVEALDLQVGDIVIDLFCGTGINFPYLLKGIGDTGQIIGVDGSAGMLKQAQNRILKNKWPGEQFLLLQQDLSRIDSGFLNGILPTGNPPKALITLALGIFPNYEAIFSWLYAALPAGTRLALMEGCVEEGERGAGLLNWIGHADVSRRTWEPMQELVSDYKEEWYRPRFRYIQGRLVVASGVK